MKKIKRISHTDGKSGNPETCDEMVGKYGRCNIQPTADTINSFPKIAQGLPKRKNRKTAD